jgi:hypothetical protein
VNYDRFWCKNQIPRQDFSSGNDLQSENSIYFPRMLGQPKCAALVYVRKEYNNILVKSLDFISFLRNLKNTISLTQEHDSTCILIYPDMCIMRFHVFWHPYSASFLYPMFIYWKLGPLTFSGSRSSSWWPRSFKLASMFFWCRITKPHNLNDHRYTFYFSNRILKNASENGNFDLKKKQLWFLTLFLCAPFLTMRLR